MPPTTEFLPRTIEIFLVIILKKIFLLIILFLILDGFLLNDLQIENEKFPAFQTVDLAGNKFTEKIFENKITILCIWTTENFQILSDLSDLQKNLRADIQIICIVGDKNHVRAKNISDKFAPNILQLTANDDFYKILSKIKTVPTVIFLDKNLNLVGQPASNIDFIRRELNYILEKNSESNSALQEIQEIIFFR